MTDLTEILVPMLRREEGVRLFAYDDATGKPIKPGCTVAGHVTIGIGRALDVNGISQAEANYLLENDLARVISQLDVGIGWWRDLTVTRQAVLVAMGFQMGITGLFGFKNTLLMVRTGDYEGAARGMLSSRWAGQTPERAHRMSEMMRKGC
jgi:lysozyme